MSCCLRCSKSILFLLNFIFVVIAIVLLATGIWAAVDSASLFRTIDFFTGGKTVGWVLYNDTLLINLTAYLLIALGLLTFFVAFFGCWGVVVESRCLLIAHATALCLVILLEIACIVIFAATKSLWEPKAEEAAVNMFSENYVGAIGTRPVSQFDKNTLSMEYIMIKHECCGVLGSSDFQKQNHSKAWDQYGRRFVGENGQVFKGSQVEIPAACCKYTNTTFMDDQIFGAYLDFMVNKECPVQPMKDYNERGCLGVLNGLAWGHIQVLIIIAVIVLVLEATGVMLASYLAVAIKREYSGMEY